MLPDSYFEVLFKLKIFFQSYFNSVKLFLYYFCIISSFVFVAILIVCVCVPFFCIVFK